MLEIIKVRLQDIVDSPEEYDIEACKKIVVKYAKKPTAELIKAIVVWIYKDDLDLRKKNAWEQAYDDPWIGKTLQKEWNAIDWEAIATKLEKLLKKFEAVVKG